MKARFAKFMAGRNGNDQFNTFLLTVDIVLALVGTLIGGSIGRFFYIPVLAILGYAYYRMFSRKLERRRYENSKYLRLRYKFTAELRARRERWVQRKDYKFFKCPACRTTLRVPRHRGKIKIVCRKCGSSFLGKS